MHTNAPISARTQPNHSMPSVRPAGDPKGYTQVAAYEGATSASVAGLAALAYAGRGDCSVWRHARPGRVLPGVAAEV